LVVVEGLFMFWVDVVFRWAHILPAIALVGGAFFMRFAYVPSIQNLSETDRLSLQESVRKRWSIVVAVCALLLIVSGFYNITAASRKWELAGTSYMSMVMVKLLLAIGIFFIASLLTGRSKRAAAVREKSKFWLNINLALAIIVVCVGGFLRVQPHTAKAPTDPPVQETTNE